MTVPPVSEQPAAALNRWHVIRDPLGYRLAGMDMLTNMARVTSPLVRFDAEGSAGTESRRRYRLIGSADRDMGRAIARMHAQRYRPALMEVELVDASELPEAMSTVRRLI